jgi:hypothetical protein
MEFYKKHFTKDFVYDYVSDLCNSISGMLQPQKNMYEMDKGKLVKSLRLEPTTSFKTYRQTEPISTNTSVLIVPFRDSGDQNRGAQLEQFIAHYKNSNILIVEQSEDGQKFNRGMLLNIGYDYLSRELPNVDTFVVHDVDILMEEDIVDRYYGEDGKDLVHLGRLIKRDKYGSKKDDFFLGRVLRISKSKFKQMNGFPNTFYGWGGEDDALIHRIGKTVVYRPDEPKTGVEMDTANDVYKTKPDERTELNKNEQIILDTIQWQIDGVNSLQYVIQEVHAIRPNVRKLTVQLNPSQHHKTIKPLVTKPVIETKREKVEPTVEHLDDPEIITDELEIVDKKDVLEQGETPKVIEYA